MRSISKNKGSVYGNSGVWKAFQTTLEDLAPSSVFIITDSNTREFCLPLFLEKTSLELPYHILEIPAGESHKNFDSCISLWQKLSEKNADRKSLVINLGGGVVTDLGGFVASTFKRGIEFINIPTSLLAMVDASVGGKNGVDLGILKNQIGVIKDPNCVIIDNEFLGTLPLSQRNSGYAEMLKHGLIHSEIYWQKIKHFPEQENPNAEALIWESIEIKNGIVAEDPLEHGLRKILNYGHTLGHAIESYRLKHDDLPPLLHGEAIAIGMILASFLSAELLNFPELKLEEVTKTILSKFSKSNFNRTDIDKIIDLLKFDKKNSKGDVNFVLLYDFGKPKIDCKVANELIYKAFDYYQNF